MIGLKQRKHFRMYDPGAGREPLHIAAAEARRRAERVAVVDEPFAHERHSLEPAVWMLRETGHGVAVIHAPPVLAREVLAHVAVRERRGRAEPVVAGRVQVDVMHADQERILGLPRETERRD